MVLFFGWLPWKFFCWRPWRKCPRLYFRRSTAFGQENHPEREP